MKDVPERWPTIIPPRTRDMIPKPVNDLIPYRTESPYHQPLGKRNKYFFRDKIAHLEMLNREILCVL
ncbi:hypothetical protein FRACA_880006 [Frankia canadensis]|uniref:Uncharacterized protein n=1 Tax=Frankia canadensis TaxID=1836972 RepID=A0A2I2L228_9ACTN|nr:hypothetical protein FRACA_880006 [Frankia canadensis]SOU59245.1 hypothetical protein FRACA_880006 [Frankia canadensis]